MAGSHENEVLSLKNRIRDFEDRKISGADLSREVLHVAREIFDPEETNLKRALQILGNKIMSISERGQASGSHAKVLELVDQIQNELNEQGY